MNGLNDTAHFIFTGIISYQLLMTLILGWCLDIRDAFFEIRLCTTFIAFLIFSYGCDGFSPMFIIMGVTTIIVLGIQFCDDPRDTHPGSLINIIKERNTLGYDPNRRGELNYENYYIYYSCLLSDLHNTSSPKGIINDFD